MKLKDALIATAALGTVAFFWLSPTRVPAPDIHMVTTQSRIIRLAELLSHPLLVTFRATTRSSMLAAA